MAEKATSAHTYSVTLTYGSDTLEKRDGAKAFRYSDVNAFLKRLRRAAQYRFGKTAYVRFLCAGELGSQNGRCHWHIVLYSNFDIVSLGSFENFHSKKTVTEWDDKITVGKRVKRLTWSLWTMGLVTFQVPDQGGLAYALSYVLKDQFNVENSRGTMREAKSENYANGYFRMSKSPPIGGLYMQQKLEALREKRQCPVNLHISIPEYSGFWYPSGVLRQQMLEHIYITNQLSIVENGRSCPQFNTLLSNFETDSTEWEILSYGEKGQEEELDQEQFELATRLRTKEIEHKQRVSEARRQCGGYLPCARCLRGTSAEGFERIRKDVQEKVASFGGDFDALQKDHYAKNTHSPWCAHGSTGPNKGVFPQITR